MRTFEYATNNLKNITLRTFVISHIANSSAIHQKNEASSMVFFAAPSVFSVNSTYGLMESVLFPNSSSLPLHRIMSYILSR